VPGRSYFRGEVVRPWRQEINPAGGFHIHKRPMQTRIVIEVESQTKDLWLRTLDYLTGKAAEEVNAALLGPVTKLEKLANQSKGDNK
jgi:hypothetical protein